MVRVALFDDNSSQRNGLQLLLDATDGMACVAAYEDCRDVEQRIAACTPDVVLMDIDMPHVNGIDGVERLRARFPKLKIIMQTVFEDEDRILASVCAGADGYLLKRSGAEGVVRGIRDVLAGGAPMSPEVARKVLLFTAARKRGQPVVRMGLSDRELEVLQLLARGHSYKMVADHCGIAMGTVNGHIRRIYDKLQVHSVSGAVSLALKRGII
jgi:DNA-binding NarL/FixJ family response regulator